MKLFIYEHITSGALIDQPLPPSLAHEGDAMLCAVVKDCLSLSEHSVTILRDNRLSTPLFPDNKNSIHCQPVSSKTDYEKYWRHGLSHNDAILVIAPETDKVLQQLQQDVSKHKIQNLGCTVDAIEHTGNKLNCFDNLTKAGIDTPETCLACNWQSGEIVSDKGYISKPIDGAGCIDTLFFQSSDQLECYLDTCPEEKLTTILIQSYIEGDNISLSLLFSQDDVIVLSLNKQNIERQQQILKLSSCEVNGYQNSNFSLQHASQLANKVKQAIPGLYGFIGIDLIISDNAAIVIDINPRLTSSYIGLHDSLSINPTSLLLNMIVKTKSALPQIKQRQAINISL